MPLALTRKVQVKDGTLVRTDGVGTTVTVSEAQSVQKQVSMIPLGELCGLPKRERATAFGFKSRPSYDDSRNAGLQGTAADLLPQRTGPHTPAKRTQELEALIIGMRGETHGTMEESADTFTHTGCTVRARRVGPVLADDGLSKKNG